MDTVLVRRKDFDINNSKRINNNLVNVNNNSFDVNINRQSKVKERIVNEREGNSLVPINKLFSQSPPSSQEINSLDEIIN